MQTRLDFYKTGPDAMKAMAALEMRISRSGLEKPLVELVRLRASQINGCAFCIDMHGRDAIKADESPRRLLALNAWRETPFFSDRERAALGWAEALTRLTDGQVPDAAWDALCPQFTPEEIVDLTLLVTTINAWNRFAIAFRKQPV